MSSRGGLWGPQPDQGHGREELDSICPFRVSTLIYMPGCSWVGVRDADNRPCPAGPGAAPGGQGSGPAPPPVREIENKCLSLFVQVNFILFVSILRILLQKLTSPDVRGSEQSQYK